MSNEDKQIFHDMINEYRSRFSSADTVLLVPVACIDEILDDLVEKIPYMKSVEDVMNLTNVTDVRVATEVVNMIFVIFEDIDKPLDVCELLSSEFDLLSLDCDNSNNSNSDEEGICK